MDEDHNVIRPGIRGLAHGSVPAGFPIDPHEYIVYDDDHCMLFMAVPMLVTNIPGYEGKEVFVFNNVIQEQKDGKVVFQWESIDHPELYQLSFTGNNYTNGLTNRNLAQDYAHLNSIDLFDDGDLLVSFRKIGIMRIDRETKDIQWVIGSKRNDFDFDPSIEPYLQHDARVMGDGSIKIYDNRDQSHGYPQVLRLWLDEKNMSLTDFQAFQVPNYGYSMHMGSAQLLDEETDTYLVTYGSGYNTGFEILNFKDNRLEMALKFKSGDDTYAITQGMTVFNYPKPPEVKVSSLTVSPTSETLYVGDYLLAQTTVLPEDAANKKLEWASSNTSVALVDQSGRITAKKAGTATITVKTTDGSNIEKTIKVTVRAKSTAKPVLVARGIADKNTAISITWNKVKSADRYVIYMGKCNVGKKSYPVRQVKVVSGSTLTWKKTGLAKNTAYKFYVVAQKKSGSTYTTLATSRYGHTLTANIKGKYTNPKTLKLNRTSVTLTKGNSAILKGTVSRVYTSKKLESGHAALLRYTSSNPGVATVSSSGKVTAKAKGSCTIYVQTINGIWKTCSVTVK